jgi:hypothetical protein
MDNYKGIYYNAPTESKSFEGGAHFRYKDLFRALSALLTILPAERVQKEHKPSYHHTQTSHHEKKPSNLSDLQYQSNRRSRNKPSTYEGICITTVNQHQNTQKTFTNHSKHKPSKHVHTRQKSDNNPTLNKNPLLFISTSNISNNNKQSTSNYKLQPTKQKLRLNTFSDNASTTNNYIKIKPKKIDLIKTHSHSNNNKVHKVANTNKQIAKSILNKYHNITNNTKQLKSSKLNLSNNNPTKSGQNTKSRNNNSNQRLVTSPQNNKLNALTVNEIPNMNKHSRNKHQQQGNNNLHGLTSLSKTSNTFNNIINLKRGSTKINNGMNSIALHTHFEELFIKKKNNNKKH